MVLTMWIRSWKPFEGIFGHGWGRGEYGGTCCWRGSLSLKCSCGECPLWAQDHKPWAPTIFTRFKCHWTSLAGPHKPCSGNSFIPNSLNGLWAAIQQVWDELTIKEIGKHTGRMQDHVDEVFKAKGWNMRFLNLKTHLITSILPVYKISTPKVQANTRGGWVMLWHVEDWWMNIVHVSILLVHMSTYVYHPAL